MSNLTAFKIGDRFATVSALGARVADVDQPRGLDRGSGLHDPPQHARLADRSLIGLGAKLGYRG